MYKKRVSYTSASSSQTARMARLIIVLLSFSHTALAFADDDTFFQRIREKEQVIIAPRLLGGAFWVPNGLDRGAGRDLRLAGFAGGGLRITNGFNETFAFEGELVGGATAWATFGQEKRRGQFGRLQIAGALRFGHENMALVRAGTCPARKDIHVVGTGNTVCRPISTSWTHIVLPENAEVRSQKNPPGFTILRTVQYETPPRDKFFQRIRENEQVIIAPRFVGGALWVPNRLDSGAGRDRKPAGFAGGGLRVTKGFNETFAFEGEFVAGATASATFGQLKRRGQFGRLQIAGALRFGHEKMAIVRAGLALLGARYTTDSTDSEWEFSAPLLIGFGYLRRASEHWVVSVSASAVSSTDELRIFEAGIQVGYGFTPGQKK